MLQTLKLSSENWKAKKKVLDLDFQEKEKTSWMINTPEKLLYDKALNGLTLVEVFDNCPQVPQLQPLAVQHLTRSQIGHLLPIN